MVEFTLTKYSSPKKENLTLLLLRNLALILAVIHKEVMSSHPNLSTSCCQGLGEAGCTCTCVNHSPGREAWWAALWGLRALEAWKWSVRSLGAHMAAQHREERVDTDIKHTGFRF